MPRTITGSYTLRPTTYSSYRSFSSTFSDWFNNTNAPSNWMNNLDAGTKIGDNSDSTYFNDSSVDTSTDAKNCIMDLTVTSGTVPEFDYSITKLTFYWRNKTSSNTSNVRIFRIWDTIWDRNDNLGTPSSLMNSGRFGNMGYNGSTSSVSTGKSSITTFSQEYTSLTNPNVDAGLFPDRLALCIQAYKTSHLTSFNSYQLYDVWYVVEYSYVENEKIVNYYDDDGVSVTTNGTALTTGSIYQDYKGSQYPLVAIVQSGYVFDGYYLNGVLVSSSLNYTYTFSGDNDRLYCITKVRKVFDGKTQVNGIYVGTDAISEVYIGTTKVWGDSDLKQNAIAGG